MQRFEALGLDRGTFPYRKYGKDGKGTPRYFAFKLPIAVDEKTATFVYVDAGQSTDSELRAWGYGPRAALGRAPGADVRRVRRPPPSARAQRRQTAPRPC